MILISIISFFGVRALNSLDGSVEKVTTSIDVLNQTMAKVVVEQSYLRRDVDRHDDQIQELKKTKLEKSF